MTNIVIKPADKGGAIVVQDIDLYKKEVLRQLNDTAFYRKMQSEKERKFCVFYN